MSNYETADINSICVTTPDTYVENVRQDGADVSSGDEVQFKPRASSSTRKLFSDIWRKFTILDRQNNIASCNVCGAKLSFKTTTSNLRKHIERKHNYDTNKSCVISYKAKSSHGKRLKLTDLGGLDGLILNVVGDEGEIEEEVVEANVNENSDCRRIVSEEEAHLNAETLAQNDNRKVSNNKTIDRAERIKRNHIMDLQMECLELKKYSMQMETLMLERQLNLPRSIHTENLRGCDGVTRGTQTDVGGENIKVFYVSENYKSTNLAEQQLFSFRARLQE